MWCLVLFGPIKLPVINLLEVMQDPFRWNRGVTVDQILVSIGVKLKEIHLRW